MIRSAQSILSARQEPKRGLRGLSVDHRLHIGVAVAAVFGQIGLVDGATDALVRFFEDDIAFHTASLDTARVPLQRTPKPACGTAVPGPHVKLVADTDDPDGRVRASRTVVAERGDLQFIGRADLGQLVVCPLAHRPNTTRFCDKLEVPVIRGIGVRVPVETPTPCGLLTVRAVASLITGGNTEQLRAHFGIAKQNSLIRDRAQGSDHPPRVLRGLAQSDVRHHCPKEVSTTNTVAHEASALAPFRHRAFRWLWLGVLISWTGTWMQTVGAQWLLVDAPNAAALVSLVQAATTLPVMLLALPGGVLADSFDRRWLLFTIQVYFFIVGILLAVLTAAGQMPPALLIAFTFLLGVGTAVQLPTWAATVPEIVPRSELRAASRLDLVGVNVSRAIGPALAGFIIAHLGGASVVFALNAASVIVLAIALLAWRRTNLQVASRERFVPALRAGARYVWHEPVIRRIMLRAIMFVVPAMALWALLPLIASQHLGQGADGFGLLFAALGTGAILGALVLGRVKTLSTNRILLAAGILYAGR